MSSADRILTKNFVLLMIVQTCDLLTYNMITPIVAKFVTLEGASLTDAGIIAGAFALVAIIARPFGGFASDRVNRKRLIWVTVVASCIALVGYAFSPNLAVFVVFRVIHGIAYAVFGTAITATALMFILETRRAEGMGYFSWSYVFAASIGPALGVAVGDALGYPACFFEALAMTLLAFAQQLWLFLVIAVLKALGQGTIHPALQVESVKRETPERSGVAMSTFLLGTDIGYGIGPVYGGFMCAHAGFEGMYLACLPVTALALGIFVVWRLRVRGR